MTATITWHRAQTIALDGQGYAYSGFLLPAGFRAYGAWAEYAPEAAITGGPTTIDDHYNSCVPTNPYGHVQGSVPLLGTYAEVSGDDIWIRFMWGVELGQFQVRAHMWVVT